MGKWKKGLISLVWVMLGQGCIVTTAFIVWMLFNPFTPYESTREIVTSTLATIFMVVVYPLCSLVCFKIGLITEETE